MSTLQNVIDKMVELAGGVGGDINASPLVDADVTAEMLFPHVLRFVFQQRAQTGDLDDILSEVSIALDSNGTGTLPTRVLKEYLRKHATMPAYPFASYLPYQDYTGFKLSTQIGYFSNRDSTFYFSKVPSTTVVLRCPAMPDITDGDNDLDLSQAVIDDVTAVGAAVLKGEIPVAMLPGYQPPKTKRR